ncbi:MAG: hypothetical protein ACPG7U_02830, partial [Holosporaceae bacterium]
EENEHLKKAHKFLQAENKRLRKGGSTAPKSTPPPPPSAQHLLGGHGGMLQRSNAPKKKLVRKKDPRQMDVSLETIKKARQELRKTTSKV